MSSDSLPHEIELDILYRLPLKSLCRFKCVSKSWLSTISSTKFVNNHFDRSKSHPKLLISIWTDDGEPCFGRKTFRQSLFIAEPEEMEEEEKGPIVLGHQAIFPVKEVQFVDSLTVAGLTRRISSQDQIVITNPITKASVAFPRAFDERYGSRFVSFGFDPVDGTHKIVESQLLTGAYTFSAVERMDTEKMKMNHRVVSMSDSDNWRSVEGGPVVHYMSELEVCVDGVVYSAATTMKEERIVAFDVRSEKFRMAKLWINGRMSYLPNPYKYIEFEGKLAIVDYPYSNKVGDGDYEEPVPALDLWVLEDFENQVWSLKFSCIPSFTLTRMFIGTTIDGELIFVEFWNKGNPFFLPEDVHYTKTVNFGEEEDVSFALHFFNMKTGNFRSREVRLPPEHALTGEVRISAASLVERL